MYTIVHNYKIPPNYQANTTTVVKSTQYPFEKEFYTRIVINRYKESSFQIIITSPKYLVNIFHPHMYD